MKTGRKPTCECGECRKCKHRAAALRRYHALSLDERREMIAKRDREKVRAADRARYYRDWDKRRAAADAYQRENRERMTAHAKAWIERNPEKRKAQIAAGNAMRSGKLVPKPCETCGERKTDAHHDDYTQPLEVRWLCRKCHMAHHRRYPVVF